MITVKEISLNNGQILKNVKYDGTKEDFEKAFMKEFFVNLERQEETEADIIHLHTDSIVYYAFHSE